MLECCHVLSGLVEHVKETYRQPWHESHLVRPSGLTFLIPENVGVNVNGNRLGTIKYAGWCGGTAVRAASYPIDP